MGQRFSSRVTARIKLSVTIRTRMPIWSAAACEARTWLALCSPDIACDNNSVNMIVNPPTRAGGVQRQRKREAESDKARAINPAPIINREAAELAPILLKWPQRYPDSILVR